MDRAAQEGAEVEEIDLGDGTTELIAYTRPADGGTGFANEVSEILKRVFGIDCRVVDKVFSNAYGETTNRRSEGTVASTSPHGFTYVVGSKEFPGNVAMETASHKAFHYFGNRGDEVVEVSGQRTCTNSLPS